MSAAGFLARLGIPAENAPLVLLGLLFLLATGVAVGLIVFLLRRRVGPARRPPHPSGEQEVP